MPMSVSWILRVCRVALGLALASAVASTEASRWQIGRFDDSSAEMWQWIHPQTGDRQIDYTDPASDARFVVGRSVPDRHWPAFQPGSANGGAGFREHPATVEFVCDRPPERSRRLRVGLLSYSARLSILQVELNGHRGWFHQQPRLAYSAGDPAVFFQPHYATSVITCELAPEWFVSGTNRLTLTAIDVPGEREDVRPSGFPWPGCSGLLYDAVALEEIENPDAGPAISVRVEPTIFFRQRNGELREEVDVVVRARAKLPQGRVSLRVGETVVSAPLDPGSREFGENRVTLELPAWEGSVAGRITVSDERGRSEEFAVALRGARRWQLWVVPHEHLDVGYTDSDAKVAELHTRVLDDAVALSARHPGFCFTTDGQWVVEEYVSGRDTASRASLVQALREGRIHVPVVHGSLFTGSASLEGLVRALYPSRAFSREHDTPFEFAVVTDVPSYSWSFASVLAAAGVKYFVGASDAYRGPFLLVNRLNERSPHRWEGPDGGRVTTWYSRHYHQVSSLFGLPPRLSLGRDSLPRFLQAYDQPAYRANDVILYGTQVENVALHPGQATLVEQWNREYAFPRLRFGGFAQALKEIERQQGDLEVVRGDGGPYWEDGLAANARVTALARSNARRLPSAEKAAALARIANPRFRPDAADLDRAWRESLLIDEHTWHADCSVRDPESEQARRQGEAKDARATETRRSLERVLQRSLSALADVVPAGPGTVILFNPSSWPRSGVVEMEFGRGQTLVDPSTGKPVPWELLRTGPVYQRARFVAPEVPPLGYRTLRLRPVPTLPRSQALGDPTVLESPWYRVILDPERGAVRSWVDRESGKELVRTNAEYGLGQWLHVFGGDALPNRLVQYSTVSAVPDLQVQSATAGRRVSSVLGPVGAVARMWSQTAGGAEVETEVWLPQERRELRLTLRVRKPATRRKEAAYVAFPLAIEGPEFRYATANGWVNPATDILPGGCQEWFLIQDWLSVSARDRTVLISTLDAPLITLGDIVRGTWPTEFGTRSATVFSYVMSNYTPEGYAAEQGGEFVFRYVLTSRGTFDAAEAARFGGEAMTPLETSEITRADKIETGTSAWDPLSGPGCVVSPESVHVTAWKQAEDGRGMILRLVETGGREQEVTLAVPGPAVGRVTRCNAVEDDVAPLDVIEGRVRLRVPAFGLATLRWELVGTGR